MFRKIVDAAALIAAFVAVVLSGVALKRLGDDGPRVQAIGEPVPYPRWNKYQPGGRIIGDPAAPVRLVVFGDYECQACRVKHRWIESVLQEHGSQLALEYRHNPLPYHRAAYPAARAAECAGSQGRFSQFHRQLLTEDSWLINVGDEFPRMAQSAGVEDLAAFNRCLVDSGPVPTIEIDIKMGEEIRITGTPTLVLDGTNLSTVDSVGLVTAVADYFRDRGG